MIIQGRTGDYIKLLMRRALTKAAASTAGVIVFILTLLYLGLENLTAGGVTTLMAWALVALAGFFAYQARLHYTSYSKARIGLITEKRVAAAIKKTGAQALVNGALLSEKAGDADHIVLGPVVAVVESKTGSGFVASNEKGIVAGNRQIPGNPIRQAKRQASILGKKIGVYSDAIVCVADMKNEPFQRQGVWVCSVKDIGRVLAACPPRLHPEQVPAILKKLK